MGATLPQNRSFFQRFNLNSSHSSSERHECTVNSKEIAVLAAFVPSWQFSSSSCSSLSSSFFFSIVFSAFVLSSFSSFSCSSFSPSFSYPLLPQNLSFFQRFNLNSSHSSSERHECTVNSKEIAVLAAFVPSWQFSSSSYSSLSSSFFFSSSASKPIVFSAF